MGPETRKRIAFYGGSFDPVHIGHMEVARRIIDDFSIDSFVFVPAFHAPHKRDTTPASPFQRFAMLCLATVDEASMMVSTLELEEPGRPYTIETMERVNELYPGDEIFFVIGADSWEEIVTWRRWQEVLAATNIIVVTRPGFEIGFSHVTDKIRERVADLRGLGVGDELPDNEPSDGCERIFITDNVNIDVSATAIREMVGRNEPGWEKLVPAAVAGHIGRYDLYR